MIEGSVSVDAVVLNERKIMRVATQLLGVSVLGSAIWVLVDKPGFLELFEQVHSVQSIKYSFSNRQNR